jgi:hypothetical protein
MTRHPNDAHRLSTVRPSMAPRVLEKLEETSLDGPLIAGEAAIAELGALRDFTLPEAPPEDQMWELMRPDDVDFDRVRSWADTPELLVGRVVYWDSRRGMELTPEEIRKGLADLLSGITFSPEAFSVYMLRWLENQWQLAMDVGLDVVAEYEAGTPLGAIAKYAWMLDGLPPDPGWSRAPVP